MRPRASTTNSIVRRNSRPFTGEAGDSPADEEAQRWAEEIRKKRESKRRWKEAEDEDRVIIGNKVDANHPNYITAYNMLTGLRVAVAFPSFPWGYEADEVGVQSKCKDKSRFDGCGFHILPEVHIRLVSLPPTL
jgi:1-phosphatidylinositol-4-phosphate 5-kinase